MAKFQFAGSVRGRAQTEGMRYGTKDTGMTADVGGWKGMVRTHVWYDDQKEVDMFEVRLIPHWADSGESVVLASGILDHRIKDPFVVPALFA